MTEKETVSQKLDKAIKAAQGKITPSLTPEESPKATQAVLNLWQSKALYDALKSNELDDELAIVLDRVRPNLQPVDMMKSTQAVLNLMHSLAQIEGTKQTAKTEEKKQATT